MSVGDCYVKMAINYNDDVILMKYLVVLFLLTNHDSTYIFDLVLQTMKGSRAQAPLISVTIVSQMKQNMSWLRATCIKLHHPCQRTEPYNTVSLNPILLLETNINFNL